MPKPKRHHIEPAQLAWQALAAHAALRATITYSQLKSTIGYKPPAQALGPVLDLVSWYCGDNALPDLTVLAVLKETGRPSSVNTIEDVDKEREMVFAREWFKVQPPSAETLHGFL